MISQPRRPEGTGPHYGNAVVANMSAKPRQTTNLRFDRDIRGRGDRWRFARLIAD